MSEILTLAPAHIDRRRTANRNLLDGLMQPPRVAPDIAEAYGHQYDSTRDAMAIGLGLGLAPVDSPMLLSSIEAFTTEMRQVIADYPRTRKYKRDHNLVYTTRQPRLDRAHEETAALTLIEGLEVVTEDLPLKEARATTAELTAKLYLAATGQGAGAPMTIEERLKGVEAFTRLGVRLGRKETLWQLPVDPLPAEQPKTVATLLDDIDALLAGD